MALPNSDELQAIEDLRERVEDVLSDEELRDSMFLVRWIRAREMDLDKAENMLRNNVKWRKENQVDTILEREIDSYFIENFPRWIDGEDRQGHPVITFDFGKWDFRVILRDGKKPEDFFMFITDGFERVMKQITENNERLKNPNDPHPVAQFIAILDFQGFPYSQFLNFRALQNFLHLGSMYEAYYPEILKTAYFINSPLFISKFLSLLRPILAPKTMNKIISYTSRDPWKEELLKVIHPEQLRPQFGGTMGLNLKPNEVPN